ncbi:MULTISPECIES: hypothetical protein [Bacteroidales]|jgi:hypothetical protein|uniref:Transmembrane protein n=2 Tax=Bacteroidales TaxID=171549 RepID=A0A415DC63_PHOVU|nr:hypothetical protein [Phocaeicola vulgatus]MCI7179953.1 hypothetical protein [Lachnospiraceae bacterium]MDY4225535.1 hypothetical protein [Bacteroides uniformis]RHJ70625.1 hypothetical protein DW105_19495 [Phocaeicola vulgatus]
MKQYIISGIVGAAVIILGIVVITSFVTPINYAPIYLLNPEKALTYNDSLVIDSVKCVHIEVLRDLESKGVLLNPSEYTSHITDYYNSLIAILLGLFAIFTFGTIYSIKSASKKEIDDIKTDIENHKVRTNAELKQNIVGALSELMRDSISFKDTCINALYGRIEDEILRHEDKEAIDNRILKLESDIKLLFEAYDNLEEEKSSNQEIE